MRKRTIIVGGSLEAAARRVAEAWHRAERGGVSSESRSSTCWSSPSRRATCGLAGALNKTMKILM